MTFAYMNHGRWVADCATPYCGGAVLVSAATVGFPCPECLNYNPVTYPDDAARIETLLGRRPNPATRNWYPGETIEDLQREDAAHGMEYA